MKVLWFVQANFDPSKEKEGYNGAGWISSLQNEIVKHEGVELALAFFGDRDEKSQTEAISYYSMKMPQLSPVTKILLRARKKFFEEEERLWSCYRQKMQGVLTDYKPDVIQIFGSENKYGLIASETTIPVILHLQGIVAPCLNAYLPPSVSWPKENYFKTIIKRASRTNWLCMEHSEKEVFKHVHNYIGRTEWDRMITSVLSPNRNYYYGSEILRDVFYDEKATRQIPTKLTLMSIISIPQYKGYDMILKTASLLKKHLNLDFEWMVAGNIAFKETEASLNIKHDEVNVELIGVQSAEQLKNDLLNCTLYVHPSYIDNSPNSVCEAQILGVTCIATNVGGVSSIIKDGETGFLIPANDPYQAVYLIKKLYEDKNLNQQIGENAKKTATIRHNKENIVHQLFDTYKQLIK